jgi:hypothetical protein
LTKVQEGEALLEKMHAEFLAKPELTAEERVLFQTVWGEADKATIPEDIQQSAIAKEDSAPTEVVTSVSKKLEGFHSKGNWGKMFDGNPVPGKNEVDASAAPGGRGNAGTGIVFTEKPKVSKPLGETDALPSKGENETPGGSALPLVAGGAVLLVGGFFGVRALKSKLNAGTADDSSFPSTDRLEVDEFGRVILPEGVKEPSEGKPVAPANDPPEAPSSCTLKQCGGNTQCSCPPPDKQCYCNLQCGCPPPPPPKPNTQCPCTNTQCSCPPPETFCPPEAPSQCTLKQCGCKK